jgi:ABC-type Mn2+/Zn2+ transport system ATPase subunit
MTADGAPPLEVHDLTVSYRRKPVLYGIDLEVPRGSLTGIIGPNGAGKSTFVKAITGILPLDTGWVKIFGGSYRENCRRVGYVPQRESVDWDFPVTVRGLVEMGRFSSLGNWGRFGAADDAAVAEALQVCDLEVLAGRQISALSGGQQQRAFLARAWAQQADIYLLDEPFTGLDRNATEAFAQAMRKLREAGKLVIASHHDLKSVESLFDHVLLINGELVASGPTAEAFTREHLDQAYAVHVFSGHAHP